MNTLTHLKQTIPPFLLAIAFACFGLLPQTQAVTPAPDGCYPGFTTAEGCNALSLLTTGAGNTGVGWYSLFSNSTGNFNTGVGGGALALNNADSNTAVGAAALLLNTSGNTNTAVGTDALVHNTMGNNNAAIGSNALFSNTTGTANTAVGAEALASMTAGTANTAIGNSALDNLTTGSSNIVVGQGGANITTASNVIAIGSDGANMSSTTWIGNIFGVTTISGTTAPVIVSDSGQLGTVVSSERFKKDIVSMDKASEIVLSLRPVTFHYRSDAKNTPQFGLIAEEVAKVDLALVLPDKEGKPYSVRYDQVNAMLLNEFLKEHRRVEEQEATIAELKQDFQSRLAEQQKQIEGLTAGLQKVSAQLEASKPAPQVVNNP
jgi:hypothetical protein